jgi:hypothetical protein
MKMQESKNAIPDLSFLKPKGVHDENSSDHCSNGRSAAPARLGTHMFLIAPAAMEWQAETVPAGGRT